MLLYTNELVAPPLKPSQGLLLFEPRRQKPLKLKLKVLLDREFCASTVHGLHQAFILGQRHWLTYFWLFTVLCSSFGCVYTYMRLEKRHQQQTLVTVVETTQLPIYSIEFPAIAVCPWNHVNWMRVPSAIARFLPPDASANVYQIFDDVLIAMDRSTFGNFKGLRRLARHNLSELPEISVTSAASYLGFRCEELFVRSSCKFDTTSYDCCKLFVLERTNKGQCLVFNSLISDESRKKQLTNYLYPYKLSSAGEGSGLQFTLYLNESFTRAESRIPFTMDLIIKESHQWTQTSTYRLYENTENFVSIQPVVVETSENTKHLSPKNRHCYFNHEQTLDGNLIYSRDNCVAMCLNRAVQRVCNCSVPLYFPSIDNTRECGIIDFKCLAENTDVFGYTKLKYEEEYIKDQRRGQYCLCYNHCRTQQYKLSLNVRQLNSKPNATKLIRGDIYFSERVLTKYQTRLEYTYLDLLANFGGVLGLFIGASALSFVELTYTAIKLSWTFFKDFQAKRRKCAPAPTKY